MLLLSTSSLTWYSLHRVFSFAKKAHYQWIDIHLTKMQFDLWDKEYIKQLSDEFQIPVISITAPLRWMSEKKVKDIVKIAKFVSAQCVTFSPPLITDKNSKWFSDTLPVIKKESHLKICVQNIESKFIFFIIPKYRHAAISELKNITWDTTLDISAIDPSSGIDIIRVQKLLGSSIQNILFSDKMWSKDSLLPGTAGGGISYLPLESFFMKLKTIWYSWHVTLKVKQTELWAWNEEQVIQKLEYAKNYYAKHFQDFK